MTTKPVDAQSDAVALLRMFQTGLGSTRARCSVYGKQKWDRINVACAALAATPAQPLSDIQVADLLQEKHFSKGYVLKHSDRTCLAWYRLGLRDGEAAHGIKGEVTA